MEAPKPGRYDRESFDTYRSWDAMNASTLCEGLVSMKRLRSALDGELRRDSPALKFGRAVHTRILEPSKFTTEWKVAEPCGQPVKSGPRKGEPCGSPGTRFCEERGWLCGIHGAKSAEIPNALTEDEAERIGLIHEAAMENAEVKALSRFPGSETSLVFDLLGVRCKARLDKVVSTPAASIIVDIKTIGSGLSEYSFHKAVRRYNYDVRAAFYIDAYKAVTVDDATFAWIVLETDPPFDVAYLEADDELVAWGRYRYVETLRKYKECLESGDWPGVYPEASYVALEPWESQQAEGRVLYEFPEE